MSQQLAGAARSTAPCRHCHRRPGLETPCRAPRDLDSRLRRFQPSGVIARREPDDEFGPLARPFARRRQAPAVNSASERARVSPSPRPPSERASDRSPWAKSSNIRGSISGAMPMPVSRTRITISPPSRAAESQIRPPSSVYLAALFSRFERICSRRVGVGLEPHGLRRDGDRQFMLPLVDESTGPTRPSS